ncbi:HD domain-containing protein [Sulfitobacter sp. PS-8MA]|uniref:HD domain-containing protein n=1 Tax=Sulfitobacter sp. PS-8MA TaxID=3237707 RepID=UPI0034C62242
MTAAQSDQVGAAFEMALAAHGQQTDRAGQLYIGHVARVTARMDSAADQVVALLHDVVEDTDVTLEEIAARFGQGVAHSVACLTHPEDEPLEDYIARVASDPCALRVKLADLDDNDDDARLALLPEETRARLKEKYRRSRALLAQAQA